MKKYSFIFLLLILPALVFADAALIGDVLLPEPAASCAGAFCSDWNGVGATDETCTTTPCPDTWDSLTDASSRASVSAGKFLTDMGTADSAAAYLSVDENLGYTEFTILFTISFSEILDVDNAGDIAKIVQVENAEVALVVVALFDVTDQDIVKMNVRCYDDDDSSNQPANKAFTITATNTYSAEIYVKRATNDSSNDGICEFNIDDDVGWQTATITTADNNAQVDFQNLKFGMLDCDWGDGINDTIASFDDVIVYTGDERNSN